MALVHIYVHVNTFRLNKCELVHTRPVTVL